MNGRRNRKPLATIAAALAIVSILVACSVALGAITLPKPQSGAWKFGDADGGFSLVAGKGKNNSKLYLTNIHSRTQNFVGWPENPETITVSGRFPLKVVKISKTYPVWAVGKPGTETRYSDGNSGLISIPAKVTVNGKPVPGGGIKMEFSYEDPTAFSLLIIEFGGTKETSPCVTYSESASHG
jgi:hypothetical protein